MSVINYLSVEEVIALHHVSIEEFGGTMEVRDLGLVESATLQPQQSFGGEDLYPTLWDKGAALGFSISENQPFLDGNKRTAALSMMVFIELNGYGLVARKDAVYQVIMKVANKAYSRVELARWLEENSKEITA